MLTLPLHKRSHFYEAKSISHVEMPYKAATTGDESYNLGMGTGEKGDTTGLEIVPRSPVLVL
jgi:hypothetical protein